MRVGQERMRVVRWATLFTIRDTHSLASLRFAQFIIRFIPSFTRSHWLAHLFSHFTISLTYLFFLFFLLSLRLHSALCLSFRSIPFLFATGLSLHLWEAPKLYSLHSVSVVFRSFLTTLIAALMQIKNRRSL